MLVAPQAVSVAAAPAASRPSSRSGSKGRDDIDKNDCAAENVIADIKDSISDKNVRENCKNCTNMCDELNVSCDTHPLNHLDKSDSDEDDDEPEEVSLT